MPILNPYCEDSLNYMEGSTYSQYCTYNTTGSPVPSLGGRQLMVAISSQFDTMFSKKKREIISILTLRKKWKKIHRMLQAGLGG